MGPPWPPGQMTDGELTRRASEIEQSVTLLPLGSAGVLALWAEADQIVAEQHSRAEGRRVRRTELDL